MTIKRRSRFLLGLVTVLTLGTLVACSSKPSEDTESPKNTSSLGGGLAENTEKYSNIYSKFGLTLELPTQFEPISEESDYHYYSGEHPIEKELVPFFFGFETRPDTPKEEAIEEWEIMIEDRTEREQFKLNSGDFSSFTTDNGEVFDFAYAITEDHVYFGNGVDASKEPPYRQLNLMAMFLRDNEQIFYHCTIEFEPELGNSDDNVQIQYDFLLEQLEVMKGIAKTFVVDEKGLTSSAIPIEFIEIDQEAFDAQEIILNEQGISQNGSYLFDYQDELYTCIFDLRLEQEQAHFTYWKFTNDDTENYSENFVDGDSFTFLYTIENGQIIVYDPSFFLGNIAEDGIVFVSGNFADEFSMETSQYKPNEGDLFQYRGQFESVFDVIA